ncbi:MAG: SCO family protein [Bacteroidetes bacterium SW_9_63_38]|nr:MAG: SCO family protein [Bacteroidetes bacterium SW_9_63_38]
MGVSFRVLFGPLIVAAFLILPGCGDEPSQSPTQQAENTLDLDVDAHLADTSYSLVRHDSTTVTFPDDFLGTPVILGTIYTSCPNVCSKITANMRDIRSALGDTLNAQFVSVTFDPHRDTPAQLAQYRSSFDLDDTRWQFLTGDTTTIGALMDRLGVRHVLKGTGQEFPSADVDSSYIYTHSNQIVLIDAQGRLRATYGGSQTPPKLLARDLKALQNESANTASRR